MIIISHNYGRFLAEAIESVLGQQLRPAEVVVIDDASDDETRDVTDRYLARGVRYRRVEAREVAAARWAGLQATKSPLVVFLDGDDVLGADYLQTGVPLFADPEVGVVTSDLEQFGAISGRLHHPAGNIEATNWVHAGSIARRTALETAAAAFSISPGRLTHHDWLMWRAVHRQGWKFVRSPGTYRYRKHPTSVSAGMIRERVSYFEEAGLGFESVTLFLALSGRDREFMRLTEFLRYQTWPKDQIRLVICDTSQNQSFGARLRKCLANCEYSDWRYYRQSVGPPNLADHDRKDAQTHRNVQLAMPRIYSRAIREAGTEYLWILEDDVGPPLDAATRLLHGFDGQTGAVSGAYRSRYQRNRWVAWDFNGRPFEGLARSGRHTVGGTGFGCLMLRTSVGKSIPIRADQPTGDFDPNFFHRLVSTGWRAVLDWSILCSHGDAHGNNSHSNMMRTPVSCNYVH